MESDTPTPPPSDQRGVDPIGDSTTEDWPEYVALKQASADSFRAGAARAAMGGYVPLNHPNHPRRWSQQRQDALAAAEAKILQTAEALRLASGAYHARLDSIKGREQPSWESTS